MLYTYNNKKSHLDGQQYRYHPINGTVYLTPVNGKAKAQLRMPFNTFTKVSQQGYYTKSV